MKLTITLASALLICCSAVAIGQHAPKTGSALPDFKLPDLGGKQFRSSQLKGSVVVLDVWATWCEPCVADIPIFNRLHEKYTGRGLKVVGIAVQSGWAKDIKRHVARLGIKYVVLVGNDKITEQYVDVAFPMTYLIDQRGKIVKKYTGTFPGQENGKEMDLEREIEGLLQ
jgi:peroxiredoxin